MLGVIVALSGCAAGPQKKHIEPATQQKQVKNGQNQNGTLANMLQYAVLNSPQLKSSLETWQASKQQIDQAGTLADPKFTYRYFIEEVETRVGAQRQSFAISQGLPWPEKLVLQKTAARQNSKIQESIYQNTKLEVLYEPAVAYYEYYYLGRAITITEENLQLLGHLDQVIQSRYKTATADHADMIRAQLELAQIEDRLAGLKDMQKPLTARLNAAMNRPIDTKIPPPTVIETATTDWSVINLQAELEKNNPKLAALEYEIQKAHTAVKLAEKHQLPDFNIGVNFIDTADRIGRVNINDDGKDPIIAMMSVNIPIWTKKYNAGIRGAMAKHRGAMAQKEQAQNSLLAQLATAQYKYNDAKRKVKLYQNTLLPKARESFMVNETAYRAGGASFNDLIDSQQIMLEYELAYERAMADRAIYSAKIATLIGRELDKRQ